MAEVKVIDHTAETIKDTDQAIEAALEIIGGLLERYAKQNCPTDTSLLKNSLTYCLDGEHPHVQQYQASEGGKSGGYDGQMPEEPKGKRAVYIGTNVEYGQIVEFSERQRHVSGRAHFIRDSLKDHMSEYNHILANELKKVGK